MGLGKFNELYTGYALVVANGTIQINATVMTEDEMKNIKGMSYVTIYLPYIALKWYSYSFYIPYIYAVWHPIKWYGYTVGWWPSFHIGWKKVTIRYCIPVLRYRAVRIYVLSCPRNQGGGGGSTPIASVGLGSAMAIINTIDDIKHTGLHPETNFYKPIKLLWGGGVWMDGFLYAQGGAFTNSGKERDAHVVEGIRRMELGGAQFMEGWYDPWILWVPPNYDGTISRPT